MIALKKFGLTNWSHPTDADIMTLLGTEGVEGAKHSFLILRQIATEVEPLEIISIDFHTIAPLPMQEATKQERFHRERNTIVRVERLETIFLVIFEDF